jgi:hypothetical protein
MRLRRNLYPVLKDMPATQDYKHSPATCHNPGWSKNPAETSTLGPMTTTRGALPGSHVGPMWTPSLTQDGGDSPADWQGGMIGHPFKTGQLIQGGWELVEQQGTLEDLQTARESEVR